MTTNNDNFVKHLEQASSVVRKWQPWKQEILGGMTRLETKLFIDIDGVLFAITAVQSRYSCVHLTTAFSTGQNEHLMRIG